MTWKTTPIAASTAIAACQSKPHQGHSSGGTIPAAQPVEGSVGNCVFRGQLFRALVSRVRLEVYCRQTL